MPEKPHMPSPTSEGGKLLTEIVKGALEGLATAGAKKNALSPTAIDKSHAVIRQDMKEAIQATPEFQHLANTETHWYQKRSFWSAIASGVLVVGGPLLAKYGVTIDPTWKEFIVTTLTTVGGIVAGYLAVRAGIATKPLGQ